MKFRGMVLGLIVILAANGVRAQSETSGSSRGYADRVDTNLVAALEDLRADVDKLKRSWASDLPSLQSQVTALGKQVGDRHGSFSPFDSLERRVSDLEKALRDVEHALKRIDSRLQRLESRR